MITDEHGGIILKTVIYADILVIVNIIVNYLMLRASAALSGSQFKAVRFLFASAAGGAFSLVIFIENIPVWLNMIIKTVFLTTIVFIAFGAKNLKAFLKCCGAFFLSNFAFAGIMLALHFTVMPNSAIYKNGVAYFDIDIFTLTVSAVACYAILSLISRFTKSRIPQKSIYPIRITYGERSVEGKALFDSGNNLCDCFSGKPAIIAENDFVKKIYGNSELTDMKNFRLIPFSTIHSGGALPAFMADKAEVMTEGSWLEVKEIYIAVTEKKIVSGGYSALIGTPFFDAIGNQIKGGISVK
ncbi:MAG: sigma-E processing peptidase SpoIIGA [Clostridia bacterium]|nr:sigma-E processing peptidase SpoIIGA [Clostridia bacterium]